jgi:hypothetical protein
VGGGTGRDGEYACFSRKNGTRNDLEGKEGCHVLETARKNNTSVCLPHRVRMSAVVAAERGGEVRHLPSLTR